MSWPKWECHWTHHQERDVYLLQLRRGPWYVERQVSGLEVRSVRPGERWMKAMALWECRWAIQQAEPRDLGELS